MRCNVKAEVRPVIGGGSEAHVPSASEQFVENAGIFLRPTGS
jgi:hypothetical protein